MSKGLWLKGCLHCHSTVSDGRLSPEDVARYYEARGYHLLSITDHEKISKVKTFNSVYQVGVELSKGKGKLGEPYHIIVLGVDDPAILTLGDVQTLIDRVTEMGGLTFIAHPYWSNLVYEDLWHINGYVGVEVYNTGCDVEVAKGHSSMHWDSLLSSHKPVWSLAVDDAHRYTTYPIDADGGWIWIDVENQNPEAVLKALRKGKFYSSMAPRIDLFSFSHGCLQIESTPIFRADIIAPNGKGFSISIEFLSKLLEAWKNPEERRPFEELIANLDCVEGKGEREIYIDTKKGERLIIEARGESITRLQLKKDFKYPYLRVELTDREGRHAWVNPIFLS